MNMARIFLGKVPILEGFTALDNTSRRPIILCNVLNSGIVSYADWTSLGSIDYILHMRYFKERL